MVHNQAQCPALDKPTATGSVLSMEEEAGGADTVGHHLAPKSEEQVGVIRDVMRGCMVD